ncbi:MAG: outer membrane beta-barrel protein [Pseudomonadota bacterium]|nr:outer membrane beta-barrel protein [Pseudomonadota bacterium]
MFRRTLLASAGAMAFTGAALAADLPSRAPPPVFLPPPPIFTWTGLYVGINAGYTWSNNNAVDVDTADVFGNPGLGGGPEFGVASAALATASVPAKIDGFIGGGQIGYNYQFANSFVAGLEADIQGVAASNGRQLVFSQATVAGFEGNPIDQNLSASRRLDYLGTVRGRLGFTITPTLLVYGTGGLAYGQTKSNTSITQIVESAAAALPNHYSSFGSFSNTRVGWTAGGGIEWLFAPNWSVKAEYLYYDLGSVNYGLSPLQNFNSAGTLFTSGAPVSRTRFTGNIARAGLNYHFWWTPAPVVAKY